MCVSFVMGVMMRQKMTRQKSEVQRAAAKVLWRGGPALKYFDAKKIGAAQSE